ncbi:TPA: hypothetical protein ACKP9S_003658 [Pseudomonas aeruginosa]
MHHFVLSSLDVERKRPLHIAGAILRHIAHGEDVDPHQINQKAHLLFGYPSAHAMHAEAGRTPLPEPSSLTRNEIRLGLTKNLREIANVPFLDAYRAVWKAKTRILDIDRRTVDACQEALLAELQGKNPVKPIMIDEHHKFGEALKPNPRTGELIAAGAPGYTLIVHRDGRAFDWHFLMSVYEAVRESAGTVLEGDPVVADCASPEEALDRYLREVMVPEAWMSIYDLVSDGLVVPGYEVLPLYTEKGQYIGRVIHNVGLCAVVPKLFYTDEEVVQGMVNLFVGKAMQELKMAKIGGILNPYIDVHCDEPVYVSRLPSVHGLRIKDLQTEHTVEPDSLELLPGLRCGLLNVSGHSKQPWAIDGALVVLNPSDRPLFQQSYVLTEAWAKERDFPLLFTDVQVEAAEVSSRREVWSKLDPQVLLPLNTPEFQERLTQKLRRDVEEARDLLRDPAELQAILQILLESSSVEQIELSARMLDDSEYAVPAETAEADAEDERQRLNELRRKDQETLPEIVKSMQGRFPFLIQFGPFTNWSVLRASAGDLEHFVVDDLSVDEVLAELVLLAGASIAGKPPTRFGTSPTALAVARWAEGRAGLSEVTDVAAEFAAYESKAKRQELKIQTVSATLAQEFKRRELARELGVAYLGERVTVRPSGRVGAR